MTLSNKRYPAELPTASGQLSARQDVRNLWVIETLITDSSEIDLKATELNRQLSGSQRWRQLLPVVNRCLGA